jgi:hypothetical protein
MVPDVTHDGKKLVFESNARGAKQATPYLRCRLDSMSSRYPKNRGA